MTQPQVIENEPSPSRKTHRQGDCRFLMTESPRQLFGPCRRNFMWKVTHVEYDEATDRSEIVWRPLSQYEMSQMPEVMEQVDHMLKQLAAQGRA